MTKASNKAREDISQKTNTYRRVKADKAREIKAWAIVHDNIIEAAAYFNDSDCCCYPEPLGLAIYEKKKEALSEASYWLTQPKAGFKLVPIIISFPKPLKRKK